MRSPEFPPEAVLVMVYVRVWVVPMSTSPGAAGAVCVMVNVLAACAGMLTVDKATSRARKPQRFMLPSRYLVGAIFTPGTFSREELCGISALKHAVHRTLRAPDIPHCRR